MKKRIGLIGFGVIGKYIYEKLSGDGFEIVFILSRAAGEDIFEPSAKRPEFKLAPERVHLRGINAFFP